MRDWLAAHPVPDIPDSVDRRRRSRASAELIIIDGLHHTRLIDAATEMELRHFALSAAFAPKIATPEGLSVLELGEIAKTFAAWKSSDKALADYVAHCRNTTHAISLRLVREPTNEQAKIYRLR